MLKAIIFDFNGIIINDEPLHFSAMRDAAERIGIIVTEEDYWDRYLPLDDRRCLQAICRDHGIILSDAQMEEVLSFKIGRYRRMVQNGCPLFPGAARFIASASERYPLAVASGARRDEIEGSLEAAGLKHCFKVIVAAEDFTLGKPHPESFLLALERLNARLDGQALLIQPGECLVIEDAIAGVEGARKAGMKCLAVCNSYPREKLQAANRVVTSLEELQVETLERFFEEQS